MHDNPSQSTHGRRRFLKLMGLGLWSAMGSVLVAKAQTKPEAQSTKPSTATAKADSLKAAPAKPPELSEDARDLAAIIRRRYGHHLSPEQLEAVTQELDNRVQGGRRLRDAKLRNADEPDVTFHA